MKRLAFVLGLVAVVALLSLSHRPAEAADPTIKEIMTKAHKGGNSLLYTLGKELKEEDPPWDDIQKQTKELVELGGSLGKNDPPKGDKESWKKLTNQYLDDAKALDGAARKKDKATAAKVQMKLADMRGTCGACHRVHRPN